MSGNPKSISPVVRQRPRSSIPTLRSLVRSSTPTPAERPEMKSRISTRPSSAFSVPSGLLASKDALTTKRLLPHPPTIPKTGKPVARKRSVVANNSYPCKGIGSLSIVGKTVSKTNKPVATQASSYIAYRCRRKDC